MTRRNKSKISIADRVWLHIMSACCLVVAVLLIYILSSDNIYSENQLSKRYHTLKDGWTLSYSNGESREAVFPMTLDYGDDGVFILTRLLDADGAALKDKALEIYSNYTNVRVSVGDEVLLEYPTQKPKFSDGTGNSYHYVYLGEEMAGKTLRIELRGQMDAEITYLVTAPILGDRGDIINVHMKESLPSYVMAGVLMVLSIGMLVLFIFLRSHLVLSYSMLYLCLFSMIFGIYMITETSYGKLLIDDSYMLYSCTFMLLALLPVPMVALFAAHIEDKYRILASVCIAENIGNFVIQTILHFSGTYNFRCMLTYTHISIIFSIGFMLACLFLTKEVKKPGARRQLYSALPMVFGGAIDIVLLWINKPSFNNSLWFTLGVVVFICVQFGDFVKGYFLMYRVAGENTVLRDIAFKDMLTGIYNRNYYETELDALEGAGANAGLGCIVADINGLKRINDTLGHSAGDAAIIETGRTLSALTPKTGKCFRTGGDEFVMLVGGATEEGMAALARKAVEALSQNDKKLPEGISVAVGSGVFEDTDFTVTAFIRRVDSLMYIDKHPSR